MVNALEGSNPVFLGRILLEKHLLFVYYVIGLVDYFYSENGLKVHLNYTAGPQPPNISSVLKRRARWIIGCVVSGSLLTTNYPVV